MDAGNTATSCKVYSCALELRRPLIYFAEIDMDEPVELKISIPTVTWNIYSDINPPAARECDMEWLHFMHLP